MIYIILGIVGAALTLVLHELSHAVVVWVYGGKVIEFKPWPHMRDGVFYFGSMTYEIAVLPPKTEMTIAPLLKAIGTIAFWISCSLLYSPLLVLAAWELVDIGNWLQGYIRNSNNDGGLYRKAKNGNNS